MSEKHIKKAKEVKQVGEGMSGEEGEGLHKGKGWTKAEWRDQTKDIGKKDKGNTTSVGQQEIIKDIWIQPKQREGGKNCGVVSERCLKQPPSPTHSLLLSSCTSHRSFRVIHSLLQIPSAEK